MSKRKEKKDVLFWQAGFIVLAGLLALSLVLMNIPKEKEDDALFSKGYFAINDFYNTCTYVSAEQGVLFDGYCYEDLPQRDKVVEGCVIGCKLITPYWDKEDTNTCLGRCETVIKEGV